MTTTDDIWRGGIKLVWMERYPAVDFCADSELEELVKAANQILGGRWKLIVEESFG